MIQKERDWEKIGDIEIGKDFKTIFTVSTCKNDKNQNLYGPFLRLEEKKTSAN